LHKLKTCLAPFPSFCIPFPLFRLVYMFM
jgi:hypothetical protein